jgi:hypothetical protein
LVTASDYSAVPVPDEYGCDSIGTVPPIAAFTSPFQGKSVEDVAVWLENMPREHCIDRHMFLILDDNSEANDSVTICRSHDPNQLSYGPRPGEIDFFPDPADTAGSNMVLYETGLFDSRLCEYQRGKGRNGDVNLSRGKAWWRTLPKHFLDLPPEIRNKIYELLLISSKPIYVYTPPADPIEGAREARRSKVADVTLGLLKVNYLIWTETTSIFYHNNIFAFQNEHRYPTVELWDIVYSFLSIIGGKNRSSLRYLEVDVPWPTVLVKDEMGIVTAWKRRREWKRRVYESRQYDNSLYPPYDHFVKGCGVDYAAPAIESVFRILGTEGSKLELSLLFTGSYIPGSNDPHTQENCGNAEIPDHVERMRRRYCVKGDVSRVEILWKTHTHAKGGAKVVKDLEDGGWDVTATKDPLIPHLCSSEPPCHHKYETPMMSMVMIRRGRTTNS